MPVSHRPPSSAASSNALAELVASGNASRYASEKPSLLAVGLDIHHTPVELREKVAVPSTEWAVAIEELTSLPHVEEAAILSTCNRMEVYVQALSWHRAAREVTDWMCKYGGVEMSALRPCLFLLRDHDAGVHLLRVAAGLESVVLGEGQILAQVKSVYQSGQEIPGFGRNLNGLFKQAVTAGKRARAECRLTEGAVSVSSAAAELVQLKLEQCGAGSIADTKVAIVGAGTMSRLLVKHLESKGCTRMTLLNRSLPRAEELAADFPGVEFEVALMPELMRCCAEADVVFVASGSQELLLTKANTASLPPAGSAVAGVRRYVDISVPRNVAADVAENEGAAVYNVDDLKELVESNKAERLRRAKMAEGVLAEELAAFESWRDSLETVPTIKRLRGKAESIRSGELDKCLSKMGDLTKKERKAVEDLSRGIVNKLLHGPMQSLRSEDGERTVEDTLANMKALNLMFNLQAMAEEEGAAKAAAAKRQ